MKQCPNCQLEKPLDLFYIKQSKCKECVKAQSRQYSIDNKDKISEKKKRYYKDNKDLILEYKHNDYVNNKEKYHEKNIEYYKNNKSEINESNRNYRRKRLETDPIFRTVALLRTRIYGFLKRKKQYKNNTFIKYIGCSKEDLKTHLELQFQEGMTWENQGKWHIDHIIPLSSATSEEDVYKLCHYTNLQPLWALDNIRKGNK